MYVNNVGVHSFRVVLLGCFIRLFVPLLLSPVALID